MILTRNAEYERILWDGPMCVINAPEATLEERVAFALAFVDGVRPRLSKEPAHEGSPHKLWSCRDPFGDCVGWAYTAESAYQEWASSFSGMDRSLGAR